MCCSSVAMTTARRWGYPEGRLRDSLVLNHGDSTSVELLRCCRDNQWDQITEEIYNYYKLDTGVFSTVISMSGQFNLNPRKEKCQPLAPKSGENRPKETQCGRSIDVIDDKLKRIA